MVLGVVDPALAVTGADVGWPRRRLLRHRRGRPLLLRLRCGGILLVNLRHLRPVLRPQQGPPPAPPRVTPRRHPRGPPPPSPAAPRAHHPPPASSAGSRGWRRDEC